MNHSPFPRRPVRRLPCALLLAALAAPLFNSPALAQRRPSRSTPPATQAASAPVSLQYTLAFPDPHTHFYEVAFEIGNVTTPHLDLQMPAWTPGSYLLREFARHVQDFAAHDAARNPLRWEKADKATWRVTTNGARAIKVTYRVYANELTVRTSHVDATHAYFNGASVFMYVKGATDRPLKLRINAPPGWRVTTPLALRPEDDGFYDAPNYDILVDSPTEIGTHRLIEFDVMGKPHRIAIWGEGNYDAAQLQADFTKIIEEAARIFGGALPYEHYTFIIHLQPGLRGGLEHLNSTTCQASPYTFKPRRSYVKFLDLIAHEFFHLWNVKRIRPASLGPFDYQRENYTRALWFAEGFTDFYAQQLLRRAGLISPAEYLENLAGSILTYETTPGSRVQSPAAASFDAWIKYYRPDENSVNSAYSYYDSGAHLGWMLDLEIRSRTNGAKSVDDVMRYLYETYALKGVGFPEAELKGAFERVAGGDLTEFFNRHVYGTEEFPFDKYLALAGLKRVPIYAPSQYDEPGRAAEPRGALGVRTKADGDRVIVSHVLDGTAADAGGVNANDEIVAINGEKVDADNLNERLSRLRPAEKVTLTVFRRDKLMTFNLTAERQPPDRYAIVAVKEAMPGQQELRRAWLHETKAG
jgi:predicted metalloprotease with PDZ domain